MIGRHLVLHYSYVDGIEERRAPYRDDHLQAIREAIARGEMLMAGATGDPLHGGMLVFTGVEQEDVERFATSDPYVLAGLVTAWRIEPWNVVAAAGSD